MSPEEVSKLALGLYRLHWKTGGYSLAAVGMIHDGDRWFACVNHTSSSLQGVASSLWEGVERVEKLDTCIRGDAGAIGSKTGAIDRVDRAGAKFGPLDAIQLRATAHGWMNVDEVTLLCPAVMARHVLDALDALAIVHGTEVASHEFDELMDKMARRERGNSV